MNLRRTLVQQFKQPQGLLGSLAGWVMTHRPSNRERNRLGVLGLELFEGATVLELGFGPGLAVEMALNGGAGKVAGLDHSSLMVKQAQRRNHKAQAQGRLDLRLGEVGRLPDFGCKFDRIYSANVVMFWPDPVQVFRDLKALLQPEGRILTALMPRNPKATDLDTAAWGERIVAWYQQAGFVRVQVQTLPLQPVATVYVTAWNY
ncbi:MAG: hypothetical protein A2600_10075 [Candidatus Lambdaproteobacteria bacterium RIFOXYD1_FULL_56_27]|uniref:Methyltransferase domain-containing protein n=1 Tax=Candidatus Lambdaproteobacteria bacterium RIFOXYD2_FULL_56_26 TaxID=1817773 RepID=A0A1F6H237_9PROT|nr:MAG: hypothetical protein A2426_12385 [Candidatus Lambdaproteobacteria bacterium RIFOXYC1_FULL_56_13]OGH04360.1 MAG: hypothetical protein A2557_10965 [Candidatus Lambdaproteobacteria bacterium RIFOXYD2_FULL_56_26]OGH08665.1 MAG: hypothetical protein A2600_10075 [Candidatus Lambdaproteobacteria bacterium RIFOXYD1_FULL_56_27]